MQGSSDSDPASVGKWSDYKSTGCTHILIAIFEGSIYLFYIKVFFLIFFFQVIAKLLLPEKILDRRYLFFNQVLNYITSMHISCNKSNYNLSAN